VGSDYRAAPTAQPELQTRQPKAERLCRVGGSRRLVNAAGVTSSQ